VSPVVLTNTQSSTDPARGLSITPPKCAAFRLRNQLSSSGSISLREI
jgi:hypothetical protein